MFHVERDQGVGYMDVAVPKKRKVKRRPVLYLKPTSYIPSEYEECKAFWKYAQTILRLGRSIHHIPNEGDRETWWTRALIRIGLLPGALDYFIQKPNERWHGLYIDMKRIDQKDKRKDDDQEAFIENALKDGYYATYAYGCSDAIKIYTDYVNNRL